MKITRPLQFVLVCGLACGFMGCKSTGSWFSRPVAGASTAPDVQYNGMAGYSSTVKPSADTKVISGAPPQGTLSKAWSSTTGAMTSLLGTSPATTPSAKPGKLDADIDIRAAQYSAQGGNFEDAEAKYKRALKTEPKNVKAILGLARTYDEMGNSQQAVVTYQQAIKLHPKNAMVYNDLGLCLSRRHELAPAQQMLQKAVEMEPGKANYRNNLASVLVDMGRPADAYQHLLAAQPAAVAHYNLACLFESRGQMDQAVEQLQLAIAKDQTLTPASELLAQIQGSSSQQTMKMASATVPARDPQSDSRDRQVNPQVQTIPGDQQLPAGNYGPAAPAANQGSVYGEPQEPAPQPQYPGRRTSYDADAPEDESAANTPASVRITDDEE
ncbi:MAG: tetratricopeptide repeat protein [Pirellulaceae bacterium]